jgi:very-short-patch-repair endonuclease
VRRFADSIQRVDFYCPTLRLAVELDGGQHAKTGTQHRERDEWLKHKSVAVLRLWNRMSRKTSAEYWKLSLLKSTN